jgi:hypothetical protein
MYTGSATDNKLWNHALTGSTTNLVDNHLYFVVPAGTYTLTFHSIARDASGATTSLVNFVSQGSTVASAVDMAAAGVNQYGPYNKTVSSITVTCNNLLTFDEQMAGADTSTAYFNAISSFSIVQNTNTQSSCGSGTTGVGAGMLR